MRKIKTMLLLALTTGALGAFAAPAVASDYQWLYEGVPIQEAEEVLDGPVVLQLEGKGKFTVSYENVYCDIEAEATLKPDGLGEITKFDFTTCTAGPYGPPNGCAFEDFSNDVPWSMHLNSSGRPVIEDMTFGTVFKSPCPEPFSWGPVDMTGWYSEYEYPLAHFVFSGIADGRAVHADLSVVPPAPISVG